MRKIIYSMLTLATSLAMTSCLHDNETLFEEPAAQRIETEVTNDKALLESETQPLGRRGLYRGRIYLPH